MMPRRKPTHSQTDLQSAWKLMVKMGKEPNAVRLHVDGSMRLIAIDTSALIATTEGGTLEPIGNYWDKLHDPQ